MTAVLTLGGCSSIGGLFDSEPVAQTEGQAEATAAEAAAVTAVESAEVSDGLVGPDAHPDYIEGGRRDPVVRSPLVDEGAAPVPAAPVVPAAVAPAPVSMNSAPVATPVPEPTPAPAPAPAYAVAPAQDSVSMVPAASAPVAMPPPPVVAEDVRSMPAAPQAAAASVPYQAAQQAAAPASPTFRAEDVTPVYERSEVPAPAAAPGASVAEAPASAPAVEAAPEIASAPAPSADIYDSSSIDPDAGTVVIGGDGAVVVPGYQDALVGAVPVGTSGPRLRSGASLFDANAPGALGASTMVAAIQFDTGSTGLSGEDREILRQVAELQQRYGSVVRIVGHASSFTDDMHMPRHEKVNQDVSARRADSVAAALISYGVPAQQVFIAAAADAQPIYMEIMPSGRTGNQRAEVYLDY